MAIAGRLAYHFEQAGHHEKALHYHLEAGHTAKTQYAYEAAIEHYQKAVTLLKARQNFDQAAQILMQLGLVQHQIFNFQGAQQVYEEAFALGQQMAEVQPAPLPRTPYTLRTTAEGEPHTLDPILCAETTSGIIIGQLFSGLVAENQALEIEPDIAQRWEILEEGRKYIFHLRSDVTWSDGTPVTAADFEYAWKRILNPASGSAKANLLYDVKGAAAFHQGQVTNPDRVGIFSLDKQTVVVELERPTGYFLNLLATAATPVPHHIVEAYGAAWTAVENIVTNGPFRLEAWKKGKVMHLVRNQAYHGRFEGNVERVEVLFNLDDPSRELAWYETGRLDIARVLPLAGQLARQQSREEVITRPSLQTLFLDFDKSRSPFADPRVRRAFILAANRAGLPNNLRENYGSLATGGFSPPGMPGHSAEIGLPHDPAQARQFLAEAGYPEGRNFPEIDWLIASLLEPLAGYLQEQWQKNLGIYRFKKKSVSWGTVRERAQQEQPALLLCGWVADYPDPDTFLRVCLRQLSLPGWRNESYDQLIEQAMHMTDQPKRLELYRQADKILIDEAVLMPLTYGHWQMLVKPWVKQHAHTPHRNVFWKDVIIEAH
jgi:oligopeptide transport system substrate-binding protein